MQVVEAIEDHSCRQKRDLSGRIRWGDRALFDALTEPQEPESRQSPHKRFYFQTQNPKGFRQIAREVLRQRPIRVRRGILVRGASAAHMTFKSGLVSYLFGLMDHLALHTIVSAGIKCQHFRRVCSRGNMAPLAGTRYTLYTRF